MSDKGGEVEPYYQDDQVTLYHGNAFDIFPTLPRRQR